MAKRASAWPKGPVFAPFYCQSDLMGFFFFRHCFSKQFMVLAGSNIFLGWSWLVHTRFGDLYVISRSVILEVNWKLESFPDKVSLLISDFR